MKKKAVVKVLAATEDLQYLATIRNLLQNQGVRVKENSTGFKKDDFVLVLLSDRFYGNDTLRNQLFDLLAIGGEYLLPLNVGQSPVPEDIMNLLSSRNIVKASERTDEELCERILSAIPAQKNVMPAYFSAAAVLLLVLGGFFLWRTVLSQPESDIVEEAPIPNPWGITEEELAEIQDVVIIGDTFAYYTYDDFTENGHWPDIYDFAYEVWEEDGSHWYSTEDGHEFTLTKYDDLRFLQLMPNLNKLWMVLVDVETDKLPDLTGAEKLFNITIRNCSMEDLNWFTGSKVSSVEIVGTNITDYAPLTDCNLLKYAFIDGQGISKGNISGFAPPTLQELYLFDMQVNTADLSALSACENITCLRLDSLWIENIDFLSNMRQLRKLELNNLPYLRNISGVSSLKNMQELYIWQCDGVYDYMPINQCIALESIHIDRWNWITVDSSFLNGLNKLYDIGLFGLNLNNMEFLSTVNHRYGINLGFCGDIQDYSGLAYVNRYMWLHVNPRSTDGRYGDFSLVQPYLQDASIDEMELYNCTNVDLATLPQLNRKLILNRGDLEDLEGINLERISVLELRDMQYLRTLKGIEGKKRIQMGTMELRVTGCPRLTDYSSLDGAYLGTLHLIGCYNIPNFSKIQLNVLRLESIEDIENLNCLDSLDRNKRYVFEFTGLDDLKDLSILREFSGIILHVPPQVADQAKELVESGNFNSYEVRYPQSGWNPLDEEVVLLSLDELETLPKAVLRRVSNVWIVGNEIVDPNRYEVWEEWEFDHPVPVLYDRQTGQQRRVQNGTIADFKTLEDLTNLRQLHVFAQPITNLDGIQNFGNLGFVEFKYCPDLVDASALFTLQSLEGIVLQSTGIDTIQGVQNLHRLTYLNVMDTRVSDLNVLSECDFAYADRNDGLCLLVGNNRAVEDYSVLAQIPSFRELNICGVPAEDWMDLVSDKKIYSVVGQFGSNEMLRTFVEQHPELHDIHIEAGFQLTDLTPLLELEYLDYVHIWDGADEAARSLDGYARHFQLDVD